MQMSVNKENLSAKNTDNSQQKEPDNARNLLAWNGAIQNEYILVGLKMALMRAQ